MYSLLKDVECGRFFAKSPFLFSLHWRRIGSRVYLAVSCAVVYSIAIFATSKLAHADLSFSGAAPFSSTIGVWYTPWWDPNHAEDAVNWNLSRYNPQWTDKQGMQREEQYSLNISNGLSDDVLQWQADLMQDVGIEFILTDLTNGDVGGNSIDNTERFQALNQVQVAAAIGPALQNISLPLSEVDAQTQALTDIVYNRLVTRGNYFETAPNDNPGITKPLLVTFSGYDNGNVPIPDWADAGDRFAMQRATGAVDPANPNLDFSLYGNQWDSWWGWITEDTFASTTAMSVSPGFDTVHFRGAAGVVQARGNNGTFFQGQWIDALKNNPDTVIISSWNDYNEETHIEPSVAIPGEPTVEFLDINGNPAPTLYTDIVKAYSSLKDRKLLEGFYYKDESSPDIYQVVGGNLQYIPTLPQIQAGSAVVTLPNEWLADILTYGQIGVPGDFDGDRDVDSTDLTIWETSFATNVGADADGDLDTDGVDFLIWQRNYPVSSAFSAATVPEPMTHVIAILFVMISLASRPPH